MSDESSLLSALRDQIARAKQTPAAPLTADQLAGAEATLGFAVPELLRLAYSEIGNGGFGPGWGLMGLGGGGTDDDGETADQCFSTFRELEPYEERPDWCWPKHLLPLCTWGCAIYSCVDCAGANFPVIRFDPNKQTRGRPVDVCFWDEGFALREWLLAWAAGKDLFSRCYWGANPQLMSPWPT